MSGLSNPNAYSGIVKGIKGGGSGGVLPTEITNPSDGQLLRYDAESEKWINVDDEPYVVFIEETVTEVIASQDDIDNYGYYLNSGNLVDLELGLTYNLHEIKVTFNELQSYVGEKIIAIYNTIISAQHVPQIRLVTNQVGESSFLFGEVISEEKYYYALSNDINLRYYTAGGST